MPVDSAYDEKYKFINYRKNARNKMHAAHVYENREFEYLKIVTFVSNYEKRLAIREIKGTIIS
jgi:hypothetical protein